MKFLTDFTYRNLHGFARFPGDSTALFFGGGGIVVIFYNALLHLIYSAFIGRLLYRPSEKSKISVVSIALHIVL